MYKNIFKNLKVNLNSKDYKKLQPPRVKDDRFIILSPYIYQADLITMPEFDGYNYILNVCNMRTKYTDVRPLKNKQAKTVIDAFEEIINSKICKNIKYLFTDPGSEFTNNAFKKFVDDNDIVIKYTRVGNHKQAGIIEASNRNYKKILNEYMSVKTKNEYFLDWVDVLYKVRDGINDYLTKHSKPLWDFMNSSYDGGNNFKFRVGEKVHVALDYPKTLLNNKRMHSGHGTGFRSGDKHYSDEVYKVIGYSMPNGKQLRYRVENDKGEVVFGNYLSGQLLKA